MTDEPEHPSEHRLHVLPSGIEIIARHDEPVMTAANRAGLYWPTACEGLAVCTRCVLVVASNDSERLSPMEQRERDALLSVRWSGGERPGERLACQARVLGDVTVTKKFVRPSRAGDLVPFAT